MSSSFKYILCLLLILIQISISIRYGFSGQSQILLGVNILLTIIYVSRLKGLRQDLFSLFFIVSVVCSLHVVALLQIYDTSSYTYYDNDFSHLAIFANEVMSVSLFSCLLWGALIPYKKNIKNRLIITRHYSKSSARIIYLLGIMASLVCAVLGLDRMGAEVKTVLPFHLTGVLNIFRNALMPFLISLYIYDRTAVDGKGLSKTEWIAIFTFGILEVFTRLSKSTLLTIFVPAFVVLFFLNRINRSFVIKVLMPALAIFLVLYPIIGLLRNYDEVNASTLKTVSSQVSGSDEDRLTTIFGRVFEAGAHYMRSYPIIEKDIYFDFSRAPLIILEGGSAAYVTHVIDGYKDDAIHSSGTTGITDPYLLGGKGLCFVVLSMLALFGRIADRHHNTTHVLYIVWAFLLYYRFVLFLNVSSFIGPTAVSFIVTEILELLLIYYYYNKRTKIVLSL